MYQTVEEAPAEQTEVAQVTEEQVPTTQEATDQQAK